MIKDNILESLKLHIKIEEVIGDFVNLRKRGNNYLALCPFHNERTPSFSVSPSKNIFKCFGCDEKGDAIEFLRKLEGMSFQDAILYLAKKYGIEIDENDFENENVATKNIKDTLYIIYDLANKFYRNNLKLDSSKVASAYLEGRQFSTEVFEKFQLGYSQNKWNSLHFHLKNQGYNDELLLQAGLVVAKNTDSYNKYYDLFRNRVIFPIHNVYGKVIAFGGRRIEEIDSLPKYINSPETEIFHKGNTLYGIFQAKQSIKEQDNCFLVEGYTDVISLHMKGITNVIASGGTSLTTNQVRLISRFTKNITIIYDGDEAGLKASLRSINIILEQDLNVKILQFPKGEDPDSFIKKNTKESFFNFEEENIEDFISFKINLYTNDQLNDPVIKSQAIRDLINTILLIPDQIKRKVFLKECSKKLQIDEDILLAEHNKTIHQENSNTFNKENKFSLLNVKYNVTIDQKIEIAEKEIIKILLKYGFVEISQDTLLKDFILKETIDVEFTNVHFNRIIVNFKGIENFDSKLLIDSLSKGDEDLRLLMIDLIADDLSISPNWEAKLHHIITNEKTDLKLTAYKLILKLKMNTLKKFINENLNSINENLSVEEIIEKLNIDKYLKEQEKLITKKLGII